MLLAEIPSELIQLIFENLVYDSLICCSQVCVHWQSIIVLNSVLAARVDMRKAINLFNEKAELVRCFLCSFFDSCFFFSVRFAPFPLSHFSLLVAHLHFHVYSVVVRFFSNRGLNSRVSFLYPYEIRSVLSFRLLPQVHQKLLHRIHVSCFTIQAPLENPTVFEELRFLFFM